MTTMSTAGVEEDFARKFLEDLKNAKKNERHPDPMLPIEDAYKRLAKRLHPDVGGSTEAMQDLNVLITAIRGGFHAAK